MAAPRSASSSSIPPAKGWTGRSWLYPLEEKGIAIGDFNMLDDSTALVIERDNGAGTKDKACADPKQPKPIAFDAPAELKRIYKIEFNDANAGKAVRKIGYIDLLDIKDPDNKKKAGRQGRRLRHAVRDDRERRSRRCHPYRRRQRQQPALLGRSRRRQGR
jgi:hypothetical protein